MSRIILLKGNIHPLRKLGSVRITSGTDALQAGTAFNEKWPGFLPSGSSVRPPFATV